MSRTFATAAVRALIAELERIDAASLEELPMTHETRAGHKLEILGDALAGVLFGVELIDEAQRMRELTR